MLIVPFPKEHWSSPFGEWPQWRKDMGLGPHRGFDFNRLPIGTPIPASGDGRVTWSGWNDALGWCVVVLYPEIGLYLGYCHMAARGLAVGASVKYGTTVGQVGNSGSATTGAHLHMTASWVNGNPGTVPVIDPMLYLEEEDMTFTDEDRKMLRTIAGFIYAGGDSVADPNYLGAPMSIYALLKQPVSRSVDGVKRKISQIQDNADTNTMVREILRKMDAEAGRPVSLSEEDRAAIVAALNDSIPGLAELQESIDRIPEAVLEAFGLRRI